MTLISAFHSSTSHTAPYVLVPGAQDGMINEVRSSILASKKRDIDRFKTEKGTFPTRLDQ